MGFITQGHGGTLTVDSVEETGGNSFGVDLCATGRLEAELLPSFEAAENDIVTVDVTFSCTPPST